MTIQLILTTILLCTIAYATINARRSRIISAAITFFGLSGIFFVTSPELTNIIAHYLGVGRGADLVFYCWIAISGGIAAIQQFRLIAIHRDQTEVVRRMAIIEGLSNQEKPDGFPRHTQ